MLTDPQPSGLSVIIPSRNPENLARCVQAVRVNESDRPPIKRIEDLPNIEDVIEPGIRIIVIDDGLPLDWGSCRSNLCVLPGKKPFVYARNVNIGIQAAGGDDVILLNDDALLETPKGFSSMWQRSKQSPHAGLIAARTNVARVTDRSVAFVCVLIPRRTIAAVGLLDERFTGYIDGEMVYGGEDDDYCYRTRAMGLKIVIDDGCFVDHSKLPSTFRPGGGGLPINATHKRFAQIHGFEMGSR